MVCPIGGSAVLAKGVPLWNAASAGAEVGSFAGQPTPMRIESLPEDGKGRAHVRTGPGLCIDGFVDAQELALYSAKPIPIVEGHVFIAEGQRAKLWSTSAGEVMVEFRLSGAVHQVERVAVRCSSLALSPPPRPERDVPGDARGHLPRTGRVDVHPSPGAPASFTLHAVDPETGPLFWSTEKSGRFVHVLLNEELVIDGWVEEQELVALKPGETMDRLAPPQAVPAGARLVLGGQPVVARAKAGARIRLSSQDAAAVVGTLDAGTEVYVLETVLGWSSILPKTLELLPPQGRSFWVKAADLGDRTDAGRP
jgi:hypothetical protein